MKNSDTHFAILGDGRLARHMRHYFQLLDLPCSGWSRRAESPFNTYELSDPVERLKRTVAPASHVLLLVNDGAIVELVQGYPVLQGRNLVHCSGALSVPGVAGAHPLMTFSGDLYTLEQYRRIPFVVESGYRFQDILPGLPNPNGSIEPQQRALYHALCVVAGNFPQLLWQTIGSRFEHTLGMPAKILEPYLRQALENFLNDPEGALTGPLSRGDQATIERNHFALSGDPLHRLYAAFTDFHANTNATPGAEPKECAL